MIDREKLAQELVLRENIRKAIKIVQRKKDMQRLNVLKEEKILRGLLRTILKMKTGCAKLFDHF